MKKTICLLTALLLLLCCCVGCGEDEGGAPLFAQRGTVERQPLGELTPAADAQALLTALSVPEEDADLGEDPQAETGVQVESCQPLPGDPVITDGSYIYMVDSYGLVILSARGGESRMLSYTRVDRGDSAWDEALFLAGDRLALVYSTDESRDGVDSPGVHVVFLDVSEPSEPRVLTESALEGNRAGVFLMKDSLCLVTQINLLRLPEKGEELLPRLWEGEDALRLQPGDVYLSPEPAKSALTVAAALRMEDGRVLDALAFTDGVEAVLARGEEGLCLSRTFWSRSQSQPRREEPYRVVEHSLSARTELKLLGLEEGRLRLEGGCVLEGALSQPGALDLGPELLRAALEKNSLDYASYTDENHGWTNSEILRHERSSSLTLLDARLEELGALTELGGDGGAGDCRFVDGLAWIGNPEKPGTVSVAALRDPGALAVTGSLPVPGQRLLLRSFGPGRVLGLAAPAQGEDWQLLMFDTADPAAPRERDRLRLKDLAPAGGLSNPALLFTDPETGIIAFPAQTETGTEYRLVRWTGSEFKQKGAFALEYVPADARGLLLDGLLYICSPGVVYVTDPETVTVTAEISNAVG